MSEYRWNIQVDIAGVTFTGPGMETKNDAKAIKGIVESNSDLARVEVISEQD